MRNETPISPAIAGRLLREIQNGVTKRTSSPAPPQGPPITRRELEILQLVAEGLSNKEIGKKLSITEGTVKNHVHNSLEKLHMENRIQACLLYTSDAADDLLCVDLGGRRIIKK